MAVILRRENPAEKNREHVDFIPTLNLSMLHRRTGKQRETNTSKRSEEWASAVKYAEKESHALLLPSKKSRRELGFLEVPPVTCEVTYPGSDDLFLRR